MLKKTLYLVAFAAAFAAAVVPGSIAQSQTADGVIVEHNVAMKTRDGVTLYADVYRPAGAESLSVLLKRTPYDKSQRRRAGQEDGRARLHGGDSGCARALHLRGRVVPVQA